MEKTAHVWLNCSLLLNQMLQSFVYVSACITLGMHWIAKIPQAAMKGHCVCVCMCVRGVWMCVRLLQNQQKTHTQKSISRLGIMWDKDQVGVCPKNNGRNWSSTCVSFYLHWMLWKEEEFPHLKNTHFFFFWENDTFMIKNDWKHKAKILQSVPPGESEAGMEHMIITLRYTFTTKLLHISSSSFKI